MQFLLYMPDKNVLSESDEILLLRYVLCNIVASLYDNEK